MAKIENKWTTEGILKIVIIVATVLGAYFFDLLGTRTKMATHDANITNNTKEISENRAEIKENEDDIKGLIKNKADKE